MKEAEGNDDKARSEKPESDVTIRFHLLESITDTPHTIVTRELRLSDAAPDI
jgi:hypothetical protein